MTDGRGRYVRPDPFTKHVLSPLVALLTRLGLSVYGSRVLAVRGRKSGAWRTTPVNLLEHGGRRYLVAPRGNTQWARNARADPSVELRVGRRRERVALEELSDTDKLDVLRAYLRKWRWEVGALFAGVGPAAPDDELRRIAPDHPVFRVVSRD